MSELVVMAEGVSSKWYGRCWQGVGQGNEGIHGAQKNLR